MKVTKNEKTPASISTGKLDKHVDQEKASDSSAFVAHPMGFAYKGVAHMSEAEPIVGQQELLRYCLSGVRKHTAIRCDGLLWQNFKEVCRRNGWSTCSVLEELLLGLVAGVSAMRQGVPSVVVQVDAPRVVKRVRRRQLVFEDEVSVSEVAVESGEPKCYFRGCDGEVVGRAVFEGGKPVFVCARHREELRFHPKWKVIQ